MTVEEARELRAVISECLDPLYAARLGNIERHIAIEMAVGRLQGLDKRLLDALNAGDAGSSVVPNYSMGGSKWS